MYTKQVKMFSESNMSILENEVNDFIGKIDLSDILEITYTLDYKGWWTAMVIYKECIGLTHE